MVSGMVQLYKGKHSKSSRFLGPSRPSHVSVYPPSTPSTRDPDLSGLIIRRSLLRRTGRRRLGHRSGIRLGQVLRGALLAVLLSRDINRQQ